MAGPQEAEGFLEGALHAKAAPDLRDHWKDMAASNPLISDAPINKHAWAFYQTVAQKLAPAHVGASMAIYRQSKKCC